MPNTNWQFNLTGNFNSKIQQATASTNALETSFNKLSNSVRMLGNAFGIAFGVQAIAQFTQAVVKAGTTVEDATTGLTTLLGTAEQAKSVIDNVLNEAQKTPFSFEALLDANKALISTGLSAEKSFDAVHNLSNAIAATGGGSDKLQRMVVNLQQIKNVGKASAMDIKQFAFAGVNIYKVLEKANIGYKKGMEVTFEQLDSALKKASEKGGMYYHGLENMANNTSVKLSNVGDKLFIFFNHIFEKIKGPLNGVLDWLMNKISDTQKRFDSWWQTLQDCWDQTESLRNAIGRLWNALEKMREAILGGQSGVDLLVSTFSLLDYVLTPVAETLTAVTNTITTLVGYIWKMYDGIKGILGLTENSDGWKGDGGSFASLELKYGKKGAKTNYQSGDNLENVIDTQDKEIGTAAGNVSGTKATNITLNITKLIERLEINTTNLTESTTKIKDAVVKALLEGLNDAQVIAGQ